MCQRRFNILCACQGWAAGRVVTVVRGVVQISILLIVIMMLVHVVGCMGLVIVVLLGADSNAQT